MFLIIWLFPSEYWWLDVKWIMEGRLCGYARKKNDTLKGFYDTVWLQCWSDSA